MNENHEGPFSFQLGMPSFASDILRHEPPSVDAERLMPDTLMSTQLMPDSIDAQEALLMPDSIDARLD